jgi:hypothetical protein
MSMPRVFMSWCMHYREYCCDTCDSDGVPPTPPFTTNWLYICTCGPAEVSQ